MSVIYRSSLSTEQPYLIAEIAVEPPYIEGEMVIVVQKYNPYYGDNRLCECGHKYYKHFDTCEDMWPCGCKYCGCTFIESGPYSSIDHYYHWNQFQMDFIPTRGGWL